MTPPSFGQLAVDLALEPLQDGRIGAVLTFTNRGRDTYHLLKWLAFLGGRIDDDRFQVTVDGARARYIGMRKKRGAATPADYGEIMPGLQVVSRVVLSDAYDIGGAGEVAVTYDTINPPMDNGPVGDRLRSNTVTLRR